MTTELPDTHKSGRATVPLALKSNEGLGVSPRFTRTYCSQCGSEFGAGNSGFSHCSDHFRRVPGWDCADGTPEEDHDWKLIVGDSSMMKPTKAQM